MRHIQVPRHTRYQMNRVQQRNLCLIFPRTFLSSMMNA
jgi:hypothetical protein